MTTNEAPERIALRWETGAAVTNGPLMTHPDYTRYIREDVAQTYYDAWLTAEGMLEEAQCQIKAMKEDAAKPRVRPLVWEARGAGHSRAETPLPFFVHVNEYRDGWEVSWSVIGCCGTMLNGLFPTEEAAKAAAQADYEARILSALVLP